MNEAQSPALLVERARELFFAQGRDPQGCIAPHISRSWQRSRPAERGFGDPAPMALAGLRERREQAMRLLECAQPELDGLAEHAIGNGCVVILSDALGLILDEIGSPDFLPKAARYALTPGVEWSEGSRGTNAIGTALAEREALMVLGLEHYLPQNGALGCAAAPIFTGRGEVAGAFDISGEAACVNQHALGLVRLAAQQVEHRMIVSEASGHVLRFHTRPSLLGTAREALVIIDDARIVAANRLALAMLGMSWEELLDQSVEPLLGLRWGRLERQRGLLTLPGGQQIAAIMEPPVDVSRVRHAADVTRDAAAHAAGTQRSIHVDTSTSIRTHEDVVQPLLDRAVRVMDQGVSVLVTGETGTGKEVFARRLHGASKRRSGPFVAVNCAALPETLIESELFGYEEGAFTGARRRGMPGRIREAHGGVLFLDEIADMPLAMQTRLLRVLEERIVTPLGGRSGARVDFDLVCASHDDLHALAATGRFRSDLLYRVAGFCVAMPPLHLRSDKRALIERLFGESGGAAKHLRLEADALDSLTRYRWPGNVRELLSVLRSVAALADFGDSIGRSNLPSQLQSDTIDSPMPASRAEPAPIQAQREAKREPLQDMERHAIEAALLECDDNVTRAASRLGVHRSTVYRHLARRRLG